MIARKMIRDKVIHIRVTEEVKDMLNFICQENQRSQSDQITYMIIKAYENTVEPE